MDPTPTPGEEAVVRHALAQRLLTPAQVADARRAAAARRAPLLEALRPLLPPERLPELIAIFRAASPGQHDPRARSGEVAPTLAAPPPVVAPTLAAPAPGIPTTLAAPPPATPPGGVPLKLDPARERAVQALRAVQDPRFAPHLDLVLERKELLGQGGMGVVHRVLDRRLGREAALKVMRTADPHPVDAARFLREAEVTARLDHPAIPPVYEAGTDAAGRLYLLMRVIEGQPLSTLVDAAHASPPPSLPALRPLLEALVKVGEAIAYAHSRRMVHRDLKPANVMVGQFGEVLVMDWGLVRLLDQPEDSVVRGPAAPTSESRDLTQAGALMGTPGYMAPEQAGGEAISEKTDVFALGAMLVTLLTGRPPVEGDSVMNVVHRTLEGQAESPRARWKGCPKELDALATAALALAPDARPTAASFVADLRAFLAGDELRAYRYGPLERALRAARRRPAALVGVAGLLAVVAVGAGLGAQVASARAMTMTAEMDRAKADMERQRAEGERAMTVAKAEEQARAMAMVDGALVALREADVLLASGQTDRAIAGVRGALQAARGAGAVRLGAAHVLARAGDRKGARELVDPRGDGPLSYTGLLFLHDLDVQDDPEATVYGRRDVRPTIERRRRVVPTPADHAASRYVDGLVALAAGDQAAALAAFEEVVIADQGLPWAQLERARLRLQRDETGGASNDVDDLLDHSTDPEVLWQALVLRAKVRLFTGDTAEAAADCDRALALAPARRSARLLRAEVRLATSDVAGCRQDLDAVEGEARWTGRARAVRARTFLFGEISPDKAAAEARRAIEVAPELGLAHGALAEALSAPRPERGGEATDLAGASAALERAMALEPAMVSWPALALRIQLQSGDIAGALVRADELLRQRPKAPAVLALRAQVRAAKQDLRGAREDIEAAVAAAPSDPVYAGLRVQVLAALGELRRAREAIDALVARRPGFAEARQTRVALAVNYELPAVDPRDLATRERLTRIAIDDITAIVDADLQPAVVLELLTERSRLRGEVLDVGGAIRDAERLLKEGAHPAAQLQARRTIVRFGWLASPERVTEECALLALARLATPAEHLSVWQASMDARDPWAAAAAAADALALEPGSRDARKARALALGAAGDLAGALRDWDALVASEPKDPAALLGRAGVRAATGELPGAIADADGAVAALPRHPTALLVRARVREAKGDVAGAIADCEAAIGCMGPVDQDRVRPTRETIERLKKR